MTFSMRTAACIAAAERSGIRRMNFFGNRPQMRGHQSAAGREFREPRAGEVFAGFFRGSEQPLQLAVHRNRGGETDLLPDDRPGQGLERRRGLLYAQAGSPGDEGPDQGVRAVAGFECLDALGDAPGNVRLSKSESGLPKPSVVDVSQIVAATDLKRKKGMPRHPPNHRPPSRGRRKSRQSTSNNPAAPMPPPTHMVMTTYFSPRRLPSRNAWPTMRAPLMP